MKFIDLQRQYNAYKNDIDQKIKEVIDSASFIMGPQIKELEDLLSHYVGARNSIACSSGTDALLLSLMAYDIQPGDEIITTPFTFIATAEVISFLKARPVFVDIKEDTYNIDPNKVKPKITERTKGIIAVDIFGQCADYVSLGNIVKEHGLFLIEDAAQSFGAKQNDHMAGSFGDIACTSFFPAKPFGCYGDGGMIFTNSTEISDVLKSLRVHGKGSHKYDHIHLGMNGRLDTLQAAVLIAKFKYFENEITSRNEIAKIYTDQLKDIVITPKVVENNISAYAQYSIQIDDRYGLQSFLKEKGVPSAIHYPKPLHLQPIFNSSGYSKGDFPVAEKVSEHIISLPMHPFLEKEDQKMISDAIKSFCNSKIS